MLRDSGQWSVVSGQRRIGRVGARRVAVRLSLVALCFVFGTACRQDMQDQPRYEYYERSASGQGTSSRTPPEGTVARGYLREDREFYTGVRGDASATGASAVTNADGVTDRVADTNNVAEFPFPVTMEVVNRGQERYNIFCSMCHGAVGTGDGMVARRGFRASANRPIPSYHEPRLREARVGYFFDVMTNGFGTMPSYAAQIPPADRWAIVAYIRALQVSQGGALTPQGTVQSTIPGGGGTAQPSPSPQTTPQVIAPARNTEGGTGR